MKHRDPRLHKKAQGGYWYLIFYDPETRRRKWVALGTKEKRRAEREKAHIVGLWERGEYDPFTDGTDWDLTLGDALARYPEDRERVCTTKSMKDMKGYWEMAARCIGRERPLASVSAEDFDAIHLQKHLRPASQRSYYRRSRALLRWCQKRHYLRRDVASRLVVPRQEHRVPVYLTREDFQALRRHFRGTYLEPVLVLGVSTGLRFSEMRRLTWEDVDISDGGSGHLRVRGKRGKERYVPLFPMARRLLSRLCPVQEHVLLSPEGCLLHGDNTNHAFKRGVRALGLSERYKLHATRHTFAAWLVQAGTPIGWVQLWMGHESVATTEVYAALRPHDLLGRDLSAPGIRRSPRRSSRQARMRDL